MGKSSGGDKSTKKNASSKDKDQTAAGSGTGDVTDNKKNEVEVFGQLNKSKDRVVFTDVSILGGPFLNKFINADGTPRGGISVHARVDDTAHVSSEATVLAGAQVVGKAKVLGRSVIGAGVTVQDNAKIINSEVVAASPAKPEARIVVKDHAVVESFLLMERSVSISADAWIVGTFEGYVKLPSGKRRDVSGGYAPEDIVDGVSYAGSFSGTGKADMLTLEGVTALKRFLLSLPKDMRERYLEELDVIEEATGEELADREMEQPICRMVLGKNDSRYVVPLSRGDLTRIEDLLKSGASFPEVANVYDVQQETLLFALVDYLGYNLFAEWEKFIRRPIAVQYSVSLPENHRSFMYRKWTAVDEEEQARWEAELSDTSAGLLYEMDGLPKIEHYSILDRPNITVIGAG